MIALINPVLGGWVNYFGRGNEVQLCPFDILVDGGDDLRKLPLHLRKTNLTRLLGGASMDLRLGLRARRDWPGSIPPRLPDGDSRAWS